MNARGLMELVIINIDLQAGVIGPALFSMLVLMAIVTTLMVSPVFEVVYGKQARASASSAKFRRLPEFRSARRRLIARVRPPTVAPHQSIEGAQF